MQDHKFRYETHQTLPAYLTDEELAALRLALRAVQVRLGMGLGWLVAALSLGLLGYPLG